MAKVSDIRTLKELSEQFRLLEIKLEKEMDQNPDIQKLVTKVGSTLVSYKKTAEATILGYERTYKYLVDHPEINVHPRDIAYKHKDSVSFLNELKLWMNIKAGANPYTAWKNYTKS